MNDTVKWPWFCHKQLYIFDSLVCNQETPLGGRPLYALVDFTTFLAKYNKQPQLTFYL
jgi:hypothetical protein